MDNKTTHTKYWANLINLKREFRCETGSRDHKEYMKWLANKYGFRPAANVQDGYEILDEKKFLVYILKHG
jgi:hypothetical protein